MPTAETKLNYAALLALLALASFSMPFLVGLAENSGVPRSYSILLSLTLAVLLGLYLYVRWQQGRLPKVKLKPEGLPDEPYVEVFFRNGTFQGQWLVEQGETEAALAVYKAYRAILIRHGASADPGLTDELSQTIVDLEKLRDAIEQDAINQAALSKSALSDKAIDQDATSQTGKGDDGASV